MTDVALATCTARGASRRAARQVLLVMRDGVARTDEEIHARIALDEPLSPDRVRHARLALLDAGLLVDTRKTRLTRYKTQARLWVLNREN